MNKDTSSILLSSQEQTERIGETIAGLLKPHDVITVSGPLGAGKSVLCRSIIQTLCPNVTHIPSPTFSIINTYSAKHFSLFHMDLYRIKSSSELTIIGVDEALGDTTVFLVEWPDLFEQKYSTNTTRLLRITMTMQSDQRTLTFETQKSCPFPYESMIDYESNNML